jgi:hypothetical protein
MHRASCHACDRSYAFMTPDKYKAPTEADDLTPVIYPFGRGGEKVRITEMTGRQIEAALRFSPPTLTGPSGRWGAFLREVLQKFRAEGGQPNDRVASRVELSSRVVLEWMRGNRSGTE